MDINQIYAQIQSVEPEFVVPTTTETLTVGTLRIGYQQPFMNWDSTNPYIAWNVKTWTDGNGQRSQKAAGTDDNGRPIWEYSFVPNQSADVSVANIKVLNIRFAIDVVPGLPWAPTSIQFNLGTAQQIVPGSALEVIFPAVTDNSPALAITMIGNYMDPPGGVNGRFPVQCLLPMHLAWQTVGAGGFILPVLPVTIIYAPPVDPQRKNSASLAQGTSTSNSTTVSFSRQDSTQHPVDSMFQSTMDMKTDMNDVGQVLSDIPIPIVAAIGKALQFVASGLGTAAATQTNTVVASQQHTLTVGTSLAVTTTVPVTQGGPGVGDTIVFYRNARVVWYSKNGNLQLALLDQGFGPFSLSAGQLKTMLAGLAGQPPGTLDPVNQISEDSIKLLLALDPFVAGGPDVILQAPRFVPVDNNTYVMGASSLTINLTHTVTSSDTAATSQMTTQSETDSPGFLSFLGLGITQQQTVSSQVSQGTSSQITGTQSISNAFTAVGNGGLSSEEYAFQVYFDVIYGTFAFRTVPIQANTPSVAGTVRSSGGEPLANQEVRMRTISGDVVSQTDEQGSYRIAAPDLLPGPVEISAAGITYAISYERPLTQIHFTRRDKGAGSVE